MPPATPSPPVPSCTIPELRLDESSLQKQMIVTIGDTVHDFGKSNILIQEKVIHSMREEVHCFAASSAEQMRIWIQKPESGEILRFHTHANEGVEELVRNLLSDHYSVLPKVSENQYKDWSEVRESTQPVLLSPASTARYNSRTEGIYLGNSRSRDGIFQEQEPSRLQEYFKKFYGVENVVYVVDNGTKLKDETFFCNKRSPPRMTYFGLASQYDRGNTKGKDCYKTEFLEYGLTRRDKELLQLEYIRVSALPDGAGYQISWKDYQPPTRPNQTMPSYSTRNEPIDGEHVIAMNQRAQRRNQGFVNLFLATIERIRNHPDTSAIEGAALATIGDVFGLYIYQDDPTEDARQRYIRCLYDLKRAGDFLQVKSVRAANEELARTHQENNTRYIFVTNDRMAALQANLQGVPCILTIAKSMIVNGRATGQQKPLVYIRLYKPIPSVRQAPPAGQRPEGLEQVYAQVSKIPSKQGYHAFLRLLQNNSPGTYEAYLQDIDSYKRSSLAPPETIIPRRKFMNRLKWTLESDAHIIPSLRTSTGGSLQGRTERELTQEFVDIPDLLRSAEDPQDPFCTFLYALHASGYNLTFFYYVVFQFLYDMMVHPYISTMEEDHWEGENIAPIVRSARAPTASISKPQRAAPPAFPRMLSRASTALPTARMSRIPTRAIAPGTAASRAPTLLGGANQNKKGRRRGQGTAVPSDHRPPSTF